MELLNELSNYGYEAYIVGGFVRDHLLRLDSNDIDVTTNATPKELNALADIIKTADRESVTAGDRVRYTITFRNMSDREMYNVKITDNLSSYLTPIATTIVPAPRPGESLENGTFSQFRQNYAQILDKRI